MTGPVITTPRGKVFQTKGGTARLVWDTTKFAGRGSGSWQGRYTRAQVFLDSEILRLSEPYTPLLSGMLIKSGTLGTEPGSGLVQWIAPYSKRQYYSARKPGSQTGPLRGPRWFSRMKEVHGRKIVVDARRMAGGG